ncbi:MAG TPA: hypothetical protein PKB15_04780 [Acidimicrobiia bacterium]|nr:hypothetical protein [Acidimicrobiia bacterium]
MYPSDGRLTTSLIAPIEPSPPKFVLLGSEHQGNGNVKYRVGVSLPVHQDHRLRGLSDFVGISLANGKVPVSVANQHLHIYGLSHAEKRAFAFHLVIEDAPDGQIAADIAELSGNVSFRSHRGLITHAANQFAPNGLTVGLTNLTYTHENLIGIRTPDQGDMVINLGKIDELVVECGFIDRTGAEHTTQRINGTVKVFSRQVDSTEDPFGHLPIATLENRDTYSRFARQLAPTPLIPQIAAGHVSAPILSNSELGFSPH